MDETALIMIVDDDLIVHRLLSVLLERSHYQVVNAYRGQEALEKARELPPDLILLDIMMPEMNGFEVIEQLKVEARLAEIPVIFLSAKSDASEKVRGLNLGAADFINKPFDRAELLARIQTQLKLKRQEAALKEYSQNLEQMVAERTRQLVHADRLASLGTLSAGIAHEINNPTTFITGNLQIIEQFWKKFQDYIDPAALAAPDPKLSYMIREFPAMIKAIRKGADRITEIVSGLKTFARKDSTTKGPADITEVVDEALNLTHNRLKYSVTVDKHLDTGLPPVWANSQQLTQVFVNLILNAADAIGKGPGQITIAGRLGDDGQVTLTIKDNGQGMSSEVQAKVFDPFFTTKPIGQGTGLGLSITHGIIQDHRGSITFESGIGQGTTFIIKLPTESRE